ncbi:MAG: sigma-70 family RNA polymerase sigma factor [Oscillospiraceae bacterium]|nr:sigma-70 family RNA polymerase sigma factor [Oscillospiraceae bacterium]
MKSTRSEKFAVLGLSQEARSRRIRRILQEELTELQRYTLYAYYFQRKTLPQIAAERGVNKSTVCRTLHRAEEKAKRFLKY